ncbi:MAG: hypothetical protein AAE976_05255 [Thermoplasmataceae archaeon]|jgi:hypothetical protein
MPSYYTTAYLIGEPVDSDFFGSGLMPKILILQHEGDRPSLQAFYLDEYAKPISNVRTVVPEYPESPYMLMDSVIAFYPEFFSECTSISRVENRLKEVRFLDLQFDMPNGWKELRDEVLPYFKKLRINSASFEENWKLDR